MGKILLLVFSSFITILLSLPSFAVVRNASNPRMQNNVRNTQENKDQNNKTTNKKDEKTEVYEFQAQSLKPVR